MPLKKKPRREKPLSLWYRLKRFAFTFELTPRNIRQSLAKKRPKPKTKRQSPASKVKAIAIFKKRRLMADNSHFAVRFSLIFIGLSAFFGILLLKDIPSPTKLASGDFPVSSQIFDRHGELLYEIYADQNRTPVKLNELPKYIKESTIAIEDKNFYRHFGIDLIGVSRAALKTLTGKRLEGGSTITQQLIKITLLTPKRTIVRKIREAALAIATEVIYSKDQILEMYLNHAPYGGTAYGIEQAAKLYFNKPAKDLNLAEAALLAGLPQAPTKYSPFGSHPEMASARQKEVLRRMREDGYIDAQQEKQAGGQVGEFANPDVPIRAPHFVLWIKDLLVEEYGLSALERGGLRVTTTLDLAIQDQSQTSVTDEIAALKKHKMRVGNGAALVTNPSTGEILAMVGSQDYFDIEHDGNVNVALRPRQPGSAIKPLMYAAGFSTGKLTPSTMLLDIPTCFNSPGQPLYCPRNYDNAFHGPVQIRFALGNSYNVPAVKSLAYIGVEEMIATASAMGITTLTDPSRYGLSLTLGGGEVTMYDMATAFGTLANLGVKAPLNPFLKIEDWKGRVWYQRSSEDRRYDLQLVQNNQKVESSDPPDYRNVKTPDLKGVFSRAIPPAAAYLVSHILLDNNARSSAFGISSQLVIPDQVVSVKTGTTNDLKDNWAIGYTPERLTAVWVGNNDGSPMHPYLVSGITGAAPIWHNIMSMVLKDRPPAWPKKPPDVVGDDICTTTGMRPNPEYSCSTRHEFFRKEYLPPTSYQPQREIWIRKNNGQPPDPNQPLEQQGELELQMRTVLSDPLVKEFCLDCAYETQALLNPDGTVREIKISYPGSTVNTASINSAPKSEN